MSTISRTRRGCCPTTSTSSRRSSGTEASAGVGADSGAIDGRIDPEHGVPADGAGAEARGEDPQRLRDHAFGLRVGDGQGDAGGRGVADGLDVEVELVGRDPGGAGQLDDHRLVGLVRHDQVDAVQQGGRHAVRIGLGLQLVDHLLEVPAGQRPDLGTVDGDVVVELRVRPDDRVDLADRSARVGLQHLDVGLLARRRGPDHQGRRAVTEDHARRAHRADLVGELLRADQQDRAVHLLQQPGRLRQPVGQSGAGRDDVAGGVGLLPCPAAPTARWRPTGSAGCWCTCRTAPRRSPPGGGPRAAAPRGRPAARGPPAGGRSRPVTRCRSCR